MMGMWEHIHRLDSHYLVLDIQQLEVAGLGSRITAYIHDAFRFGKQNHVHHIVVHAFVRCTDGRYLITKRSPNKGFPLMWETTGGSALAGEDSLTAALREVREETGIQVDPSQAQLVTTRPWIDHFDDIWLFRADFSLEDVTLLEGETCDACLATGEEIVRLWHRGEFVPTDALDQLLDQVETL